jgi:hypothetical protein
LLCNTVIEVAPENLTAARPFAGTGKKISIPTPILHCQFCNSAEVRLALEADIRASLQQARFGARRHGCGPRLRSALPDVDQSEQLIATADHKYIAEAWSPSKLDTVVSMTRGHRLAVIGAVIVAAAILLGIVFGSGQKLPFNINANQDIRTICLALWAFVVPSWWTLEDEVWPGSAQNQKGARLIWLVFGGAVLIMIGATPPK